MFIPAPHEEQLTVAAAVVFVLSVGVVSTLPSVGPLSVIVMLLSANVFLYQYLSD